MNGKRILAALLIFTTGVWMACSTQPKKKKPVVQDTTINIRTSYNNLFLDSNIVKNFLLSHGQFDSFHAQYLDFYKQRNYEFAWFDSSGIAEQTRNFYNMLGPAIETLQDSGLYNKSIEKLYTLFTADTVHPKTKAQMIEAELSFTGQFFTYAAKMYKGSDMDVSELGWFIPRKKVDLTAILDSTILNKGNPVNVPLNSQYNKLQTYLQKYYDLRKIYPVDTLSMNVKKIQKGDSSLLVKEIQQRLFLLGDLEDPDTTGVFDTSFLTAVKRFQERMGLTIDGVIGQKVIDELNVPINTRIQQILVNLERVRWLPAEKDSIYMVVNIPEYRLHVFQDGEQTFSMRVIVGTAANGTVVFNGNLKYIVFSPYWNVPTSIVKNEIVPGIQKNPNYIAEHNMEITGNNAGLPVVRQKPGGTNSLGLVKFLFPNTYDIYLHDTPNRDLFNSSNRSFSHGCIRVGNPVKLAEFLLRNDTAWTSQKIDSAMHMDKEKWVTLQQSVPVFIVYLTAWIDQENKLNFRKDIYGHDAKMADKLFVRKW
ncbi:L,D-transpeptidase family protein [Danxiaibacter flavus]|uniref:L,D-transpeptidase family protein n=1 Tax=Danxiaibacter flavus TaxID=3049108 RepID=A0ABV3ZFE6_9BACT|nr:L,D-transpeptidase family protein [Chitinophagaceae bacterium DXS]